MSFLGGPECSTGSNPLAQFQKQTSADTSLQRDRLSSRQPLQQNAFRNGQQLPDDSAFQDFAQRGPRMGEMLPNEAFHLDQLRREAEHFERTGGGGGSGAGEANWAGEFAQKSHFMPADFAAQQHRNNTLFHPKDFSHFQQSQFSPSQRAQSPTYQQSAYRAPMFGSNYGGMGMGMHSQMPFQQPMWNQQQEPYEGKGKGRVQELSDTDWEKQFEELSTADKEADLDELDRDAEQAIEDELNQLDR